MTLTVTLNPSVDRLVYVRQLVPHDTSRILRIEEDAGGKGVNVARVLKRLGVPVVATGFLGGRAGRYVLHELSEVDGVECRFVWVNGNTRTNLAIQEEDGSPPTALNERGPQISLEELDSLLRAVEELSRSARFVALGGSLPPGVPTDIYAMLAEIASRHGAKVVLDADGEPLVQGLKASPFLIKPNENETERLLGRTIDTIEDAAKAAQDLHAGGVPVVIVSKWRSNGGRRRKQVPAQTEPLVAVQLPPQPAEYVHGQADTRDATCCLRTCDPSGRLRHEACLTNRTQVVRL